MVNNIFTAKNFAGYAKFLVITSFLTLIFVLSTLAVTYDSIIKHTQSNLVNIERTDGIDLNIMCTVTNCAYIQKGDKVYEKVNDILRPTNKIVRYKKYSFLPSHMYITEDMRIAIHCDELGITTVISESPEINALINMSLYTWISILIFVTILYVKSTIETARAQLYENRSLKLELESKLQRTIAESAHHEMLQPVAIIKTIFNEISDSIIEILNRELPDSCMRCENHIMTKLEKEIIFNKEYFELYIDKINMNIERLEAVLYQMSETKHLKYSNGDTSIRKIIVNVMAGVNSFSLNKSSNKLEYVIHDDKQCLTKYSTSNKLTNGTLLNIINNHVTNSKDANSTKITFRVLNVNDGKLELTIEDNGSGIRDNDGELIDVNKIFEAGFSTKDKNGKLISLTGVEIERRKTNKFRRFFNRYFFLNIKRMLSKLLNNLFMKAEQHESPRGVGLFINKEIMKNAGGDIELLKTSSKGTIFKLIIPIKELE